MQNVEIYARVVYGFPKSIFLKNETSYEKSLRYVFDIVIACKMICFSIVPLIVEIAYFSERMVSRNITNNIGQVARFVKVKMQTAKQNEM